MQRCPADPANASIHRRSFAFARQPRLPATTRRGNVFAVSAIKDGERLQFGLLVGLLRATLRRYVICACSIPPILASTQVNNRPSPRRPKPIPHKLFADAVPLLGPPLPSTPSPFRRDRRLASAEPTATDLAPSAPPEYP